MPDKQLSAGDHIASRCTKCKNITNHTIVAMVGNTVARVECNTCGGVHNYRDTTRKKIAPRSKPSGTKPAQDNKVEAQWEELLNHKDPAAATPYNMQMVATPEDLIQHPNFGLGCVINLIRPNKMEVHFRSGIKLLRCSIS